mmetsp:Transcript_7812/g.15499  ORF Transcript_7812/g.15499 Transcript_7812/m.15499 type:complete len:105 (-) Transcript_7812:741-1055(-)
MFSSAACPSEFSPSPCRGIVPASAAIAVAVQRQASKLPPASGLQDPRDARGASVLSQQLLHLNKCRLPRRYVWLGSSGSGSKINQPASFKVLDWTGHVPTSPSS